MSDYRKAFYGEPVRLHRKCLEWSFKMIGITMMEEMTGNRYPEDYPPHPCEVCSPKLEKIVNDMKHEVWVEAKQSGAKWVDDYAQEEGEG